MVQASAHTTTPCGSAPARRRSRPRARRAEVAHPGHRRCSRSIGAVAAGLLLHRRASHARRARSPRRLVHGEVPVGQPEAAATARPPVARRAARSSTPTRPATSVLLHRDRGVRREQVEPARRGDQRRRRCRAPAGPSRRTPRRSAARTPGCGSCAAGSGWCRGWRPRACPSANCSSPSTRCPAPGQLHGGGAAERPEPDDDVVDRRHSSSRRSGRVQPAAAASGGCRGCRPPSARTSRACRPASDMPRCTDSQIAQSCRLTRSQSSPASAGSKSSAADLVRRRTAACTPPWCGRRRAGAARTRRRGRPSRRAAGWGRPARPCAARARPRRGRAAGARSVVPVVVNVQAPSRCGTPRVPVEAAPPPANAGHQPASARGAPARSGSTRCSSPAAPCSWRPRRSEASRPVTSRSSR